VFRFMRKASWLCVLLIPLTANQAVRAGLYYTGETFAQLPSQWRGFLLDQRMLRSIGLKPAAGSRAIPARLRYRELAANLETAARSRQLTPDEKADLGALYIRLGDIERALALLRDAVRAHPDHFRLSANLGTAWQLHGDLQNAATALEDAVRLAPADLQQAEKCHLRLIRLRQRQGASSQALDDLFGMRYVSENNQYVPGQLTSGQRDKLPPDAVAITQRLALWLPADGRLLWQLAELANAHGDLQTAAAIMDGCVNEFAMRDPELRQHRQVTRVAADRLDRASKPSADTARTQHQGHAAGIRPRSTHPLLARRDLALPPVRGNGVNDLPWSLFAETSVDRKFHPTFPEYLHELDGKQVAITGYMQPIGENDDYSKFMLIENPVGCWYCEMPDISAIVLVQPDSPEGVNYSRSPIKITGKLTLNGSDPENFLYIITKAQVAYAD
jgi:tetratricopeptide (TPR) repeat protein